MKRDSHGPCPVGTCQGGPLASEAAKPSVCLRSQVGAKGLVAGGVGWGGEGWRELGKLRDRTQGGGGESTRKDRKPRGCSAFPGR